MALLAAAAVVVRRNLAALNVPTSCFAELLATGPVAGSTCVTSAVNFFTIDNSQAVPLMQVMGIAPLIAGVLLGVGLVSREIETGTAGLAWSLSGSRARWLVGRVVPVATVLVVLLVVLAIASNDLVEAREPWVQPGQSLVDRDAHGLILVLRGLVAFVLALIVGAVVGRTLPSVILATVVVVAMSAVGVSLSSEWLKASIEYTTTRVDAVSLPGGLAFGSMSRDANGVVIPDDVAFSLAPSGVDPASWVAEHYENVWAVVPGTVYPRYVQAVSAVVVGILAVAAAALFVTVERRRPR